MVKEITIEQIVLIKKALLENGTSPNVLIIPVSNNQKHIKIGDVIFHVRFGCTIAQVIGLDIYLERKTKSVYALDSRQITTKHHSGVSTGTIIC
jgi:hypothetical protein